MESIIDFISKELMVLLVAAMPVAELRAAIPLGVSLGMSPIHAMILGVIGSIIPVPFLLFFLRPIFKFLRKSPIWRKFVDWITKRTMRKTGRIQKYSAIGLLVFVAIPLPGTGVWTGSIAASLLNIPIRFSFAAILAGNLIAGIIMTMISHMATTL
jgi:uncharacterized membrane protein